VPHIYLNIVLLSMIRISVIRLNVPLLPGLIRRYSMSSYRVSLPHSPRAMWNFPQQNVNVPIPKINRLSVVSLRPRRAIASSYLKERQ
jgi:hypothetical protein